MAVVVGVAQAPVRAQVNALQQLGREIIGSSFDSDFSSSLAGSNSVVDGSAINSGSVMTNLVDSEIRRRPSSIAQSAPSSTAKKTVQLLVPVKTGLEFKNIQALIPSVKILEMSKRVFVLVAETARALPAYNLGRKLQKQLDIIFELAYSDNHPDLNLAWLSKINGDIASTPKINGQEVNKTHANVAHQPNLESGRNDSIKKIESTNNSDDLGVLAWSFSAPSDNSKLNSSISEPEPTNTTLATENKPEINFSPVQSNSLVVASESPDGHNEIAPIEDTGAKTKFRSSLAEVLAELKSMRAAKVNEYDNSTDIVDQVWPTVEQPPLIHAARPSSDTLPISPKPEKNTASHALVEVTSAESKSVTSIDNILADIRSMRASTSSYTFSDLSSSKSQKSNSLVNAVAIKPVHFDSVPVVSSRYMATNKDLAYVYVKIRDKSQIASLQNVRTSPVVHYHRGEMLARVGVYRDTKVGHRLQRSQLQQLSRDGFEVRVVANNTTMLPNNFTV